MMAGDLEPSVLLITANVGSIFEEVRIGYFDFYYLPFKSCPVPWLDK